MKKDFTIYKTLKEWEEAGTLDKSYYPEEIDFAIVCKKCKAEATIWHEFDFAYGQQNIIKCKKCDNENELYGVDG